jgi:hypothetical protein
MKISESHSINVNSNALSFKEKISQKIYNAFPYAKARTVEAYFALPKNERERFGFYLNPVSLPCPFNDDTVQGWEHFDMEIRKRYPIQGWFREWFLSIDNPVYWFFYRLSKNIRGIKNNVRRFIKPCHPRFRKVYPRHKWHDLKEVIEDINFALIQDFYYEEISKDFVNWNSTDEHKAFRAWIEDAIFWIEKAEPQAQKDLDAAYENVDKKNKSLSYEQKYAEVNRIERTIEETNTRILKEMIEHRGFFWT